MTTEETPVFDRLGDYARHWSAMHPTHEALVLADDRWTYQRLANHVQALSKALLAAGVRHGDRVAMLVGSRPEFFAAMLAASDIGAIWLGLHPRYQLPEFRHALREATPKILLAFPEIDGRSYASELQTLCNEFECVEQLVSLKGPVAGAAPMAAFLAAGKAVSDRALDAARSRVDAGDTAVIIFTSGTTGAPKGAMVSHRGLITGALTQRRHWPSDAMRLLQTMPANHIACIGMSTAQALVSGGATVFIERFSPAAMLDVIESEQITFVMHSPAVFHMLMSEPDIGQRDLSSIEYLLWAGAPMMPKLIKSLRALGARLGTAFGMTELGAYVCYSAPDAAFEVLASTIGAPEPSYELRLGTATGEPVEIGQEGEIQARGPWLMNGYFNHPELTREDYTADGWFRTGDIAVVHEDGTWALVGRSKEMFKSGGYNVYPREVELAIESHPDVAMAAVLGVPDPLWYEVGYAFVQPAADRSVDVERLTQWCRERLANYKIPKTFEVMTELPKLPIGKIDKQGLRRSLNAAQ